MICGILGTQQWGPLHHHTEEWKIGLRSTRTERLGVAVAKRGRGNIKDSDLNTESESCTLLNLGCNFQVRLLGVKCHWCIRSNCY